MPPFLITMIGQVIFKLALYFLEEKWPGISPIFASICQHIASQPDSAVAVKNVATHLSAMPGMSELK